MKQALLRNAAPIAAVFALGLATPAMAQDHDWNWDGNWYVSGAVGPVFGIDQDIDITTATPEYETDTGLGGAVAFGYKFMNGLRAELEGSLRDTDIDSVEGFPTADGELMAAGLLANLVYDIDLGHEIMPYIGAGAGFAQVEVQNLDNVVGGSIDDEDTVFAYQGIAGLAWQASDRLSLFTDYRYFATADADIDIPGVAAEGELEYATHTVMLGVRWLLSEPKRPTRPAPTPVAAPAPQPEPMAEPEPVMAPRNYIVFFNFDSSTITDDARAILRTAASDAQAGMPARIRVTGHTDRAGSIAYNQRLGERRAEAVKAELVRLGLEGDMIVTSSQGESNPLNPTADGVRDPQNRRVEIVFN